MKINVQYHEQGTVKIMTVEKVINNIVVASVSIREKDGHRTVFIRGKKGTINARALLQVFLGCQVELNHIA